MLKKTKGGALRRAACAGVAAMLAVGLVPGAALAKSSPDSVGHPWAEGYIDRVSDLGIMNGSGGDHAGDFGVGFTLTRAELAQLVANWAGAETEGVTADTTGIWDLAAGGEWYTGAANWAVENGIVTGWTASDGTVTFDAGGTVSREQAATVLCRWAEDNGVDVGSDGAGFAAMPDADQTSSWAVDAMEWANDAGVLTGFDGVWAEPQRAVAREEMAKMVVETYDAIAEAAGDPGTPGTDPGEEPDPRAGNGSRARPRAGHN